jgi:hypothetical protein
MTVVVTYPVPKLLFHERLEQVEHGSERWAQVDVIHAFRTNRVTVLEQHGHVTH